jgi:hypothetical protein
MDDEQTTRMEGTRVREPLDDSWMDDKKQAENEGA